MTEQPHRPTNGPEARDGSLAPTVQWLSNTELQSVYSSGNWNDLAEDQQKDWWIVGGGEPAYSRLRRYLDESGLMAQYRIAERAILKLKSADLTIADLAAGVGWTSALMSRLPSVRTVQCVEISQHRLELILPEAVRMFDGEPTKLKRYVGSFYELAFEASSVDVVFISQAFHHAAAPLRLLTEVDRILKPGGRLILIGETYIGATSILRRILRTLVVQGTFRRDFFELFPPDDLSGDHYYRRSDYRFFFRLLGFNISEFCVDRKRGLVIVADKRS